MRTMRGVLVVGAVIAILGCGGLRGDALRQATEGSCGDFAVVAPRVELVQLDRELPPPELAVSVELGAEWSIDGAMVGTDLDALHQALVDKATTAKELSERAGPGFAFEGELLLLVPPDTPARTVLQVLEVAHRARFTEVRFVVRTRPSDEPDLLDAANAADLRARLEGRPPDMTQVLLAEEMSELVAACPGAQRTFSAVARASADMKCPLLMAGLADALPRCPLTDGEKVITLAQLITSSGTWEYGTLELSLDPRGTRYEVDLSADWSTLAPWWAEAEAGPSWWVPASAPP